MSVAINTRSLPGIGVCHELTLGEGTRLAVVTRRTGLHDLVVYDRADADEALVDVVLTESEANALAELLGGPQLMGALSALDDTKGLNVQQLPLFPRSPYVDRPLGDTKARTRTGVSIVAVVRDGTVHPSPGPSFVLHAYDLIAVVGTDAAIEQLVAILAAPDAGDSPAATADDLAPPGPAPSAG
jgi:TrkA domain protein